MNEAHLLFKSNMLARLGGIALPKFRPAAPQTVGYYNCPHLARRDAVSSPTIDAPARLIKLLAVCTRSRESGFDMNSDSSLGLGAAARTALVLREKGWAKY